MRALIIITSLLAIVTLASLQLNAQHLEWITTLPGFITNQAGGKFLAIDSQGNIYVAGEHDDCGPISC